jgi:long-subunit fatty acid transport protein
MNAPHEEKMMQIICLEKTLISFTIAKKTALIKLATSSIFILFFLLIHTANAQFRKFSGWSSIVNTIKIGQKSQLIFDINIRSTDHWTNIETTILRPGISFSVNKRTSLSIGVAFIENRKTISGVTDLVSDNRLWQQWQTFHKLGKNNLQHRLRLEERMVGTLYAEANELKKRNPKFNSRIRYFNRYQSGFRKGVTFKTGPYWILQNEFFFNALGARYANNKIFDQSRTFAGTGWRISPKTDLEIGYMLQHVEGSGLAYTNNHILQLSSFLRL